MRLHYVAFSRPEKVLVLTSHTQPKETSHESGRAWRSGHMSNRTFFAAHRFALKDHLPVKRAFSFTGDLKVYETCPRQYQFFREYDFTPSRSALIFFGLLCIRRLRKCTGWCPGWPVLHAQ